MAAGGVVERSGERVAIKKISPFHHTLTCLRTLREVKILKALRHDNLVGLIAIVPPPPLALFSDVYLVQVRTPT